MGHAVPKALQELDNETILHKTGYSAPGLKNLVENAAVESVVVAGLLLHACVRQALVELFERGIQVVVAADAVASDDPVHAAVTRRYFEDRSVPFTASESIINSINRGCHASFTPLSTDLLNATLERAAAFARSWSRSPFSEKSALVTGFARNLAEAVPSLSLKVTTDTGKPIRFAETEVARCVEMATAILRRFDLSKEQPSGEGVLVRRMPHGVVAVITPWNNPVYLPLGKILPAILAGNAVVWKPAPETNGIAQSILEILHDSGCPRDLVQLIPGDARTGRLIMAHHCVDAVTMTASDAAGFSASEICGRRRIPLQAELGGNNAAIILADADLTSAASKIASGAFEMSGQRCTANRRAIVESKCLAGFLDFLKVAMAGLCNGNPLDPETVIGPLVSRDRRIKVEGIIRRAIADGHTVFQMPFDEDRNGPSYFPPTIVLCDDPSHEVVQEETFGPVLVIQSVENLEEALKLCNAVRQGLAAAIFSTSNESIEHFLGEARSGILKVNRSTADASVDVPFGGWKASGIGPAEHGDADLEFYFRTQTVYK